MNARRRPSESMASLRRGLAPAAKPEDVVGDQQPEDVAIADEVGHVATEATAATPPAKPKSGKPAWQLAGMSRYTVNLDPEAFRVFDELMIAARRQLGGRVDKSEIIRAFLLLAADDASLREQVVNEIARQREQ